MCFCCICIKSSVNAQAGVYDMNFTFSTRVRFYLELSCRFDIHIYRGVEIQCQWHQLSGAKSELDTAGLVIGNLLLSTLLKIIT